MPDVSTFLLVTIAVLDATSLTLVVLRPRVVANTLAWIFAILAFPGIGALVYLALVSPRLRRVRWLRRHGKRVVAAEASTADARRPDALGLEDPDDRSLVVLMHALTDIAPTRGNRVELLPEDHTAFGRVQDAIRAAKRSVWAQFYIIQRDATGSIFLDALAECAARGVEVRLLYDALGSAGIDTERLRRIRAAGGDVLAFQPIGALGRLWAAQLRNHRKVVVVDGERGFTGGMNVGNEYSWRHHKRTGDTFIDSLLELEGPAVRDLACSFADDWKVASQSELELPEARQRSSGADSVVAVVPSGPLREPNGSRLAFIASINSARARCWLTTPYFIPDESTTDALVSAVLRGVDVRVLVPRRSDVRVVQLAARSYYPLLAQTGVRIFEYVPAMLHAKTLVVDGVRSFVGSANFDVRSFRLNFEIGALVIDRDFARALERRYERHLEHSAEILAKNLEDRPFVRRLLEGTARLLSPLL